MTASAGGVVTHTYGFGNIHEPKCLGGVDGDDCRVLIPNGPGCVVTPNGNCASRGPGVQVSSGAHTQSDPSLPLTTYFGTIVIEEDTGAGTVSIPVGSRSGFALQSILNLDLGFDTFVIFTATEGILDGATGTGSPSGTIVWNNPVPYDLQGCLQCLSGTGGGCGTIGLGPDGAVICDDDIQPGDPGTRPLPSFISYDGGDTFQMPDDGDAFFDQTEALPTNAIDLGTPTNGGALRIQGFRERECGTTNDPGTDPTRPQHAKPDPDCDGTAEWFYGLAEVGALPCDDQNDGTLGQEGNPDGDCQVLVEDPTDPCPNPNPHGLCPLRNEAIVASYDQIQSDPGYPWYPSPGRILIEEDPVAGTVSLVSSGRSGWINNAVFVVNLPFDTVILDTGNGHLIDGGTGVGTPKFEIDWNFPVPWENYGCLICNSGLLTTCDLFGLGPENTVICGDQIQAGDPRERDFPDMNSLNRGETWGFPDDGSNFFDGTESIKANAPDLGQPTNGGAVIWRGFLQEECADTSDPGPDPLNPTNGQRDGDCDLINDEDDGCPDYVQRDNTDTDGNGRADECECGDQSGDGTVDVSDILAINAAIFDPTQVTPLCDANNDGQCNVNDILAVNSDIFSADVTSTCYRSPFPIIVSP
jgi:hypothetical protein